MNTAQLVQDVLDGKESAVKALVLLIDEKLFIDKCIGKISEAAIKELQTETK